MQNFRNDFMKLIRSIALFGCSRFSKWSNRECHRIHQLQLIHTKWEINRSWKEHIVVISNTHCDYQNASTRHLLWSNSSRNCWILGWTHEHLSKRSCRCNRNDGFPNTEYWSDSNWTSINFHLFKTLKCGRPYVCAKLCTIICRPKPSVVVRWYRKRYRMQK